MPGHHVGSKILDDDIGVGRQSTSQCCRTGRVEIDADTLLPGVLLGVIAREAAADVVSGPRDVPLRRLELDHFRSEITEHAPREGAGQDSREVENADAFEGRSHFDEMPQRGSDAPSTRTPSGASVGLAEPRKLNSLVSTSSNSIFPLSTLRFHS